MDSMSDLSAYFVLAFLGFILLGSLVGIVLGIIAVVRDFRMRGWESGWSLLFRDGFVSIVVIFLYLAYSEGKIEAFWTFLLAGLAGLPGAAYVLWNDHKFRRLVDESI